MVKFLSRFGLVLAVAMLVTLVIPACSAKTTTPPQTTPAAKPAYFRIGIMGGQTGPAAAAVSRQLQEMENMLKYTNEVEGGISGVQLQWKIIDNKGTPDGAVIAYKELRDTFKPHVYLAIEDYYYAGVIPNLIEDKSVLIATSAIVSQLYVPAGRIFSISMSTADGFAAYINWVLSQWKGTGKAKVGVLYWDDVASGQQWRAAQAWVAQQNIELVPVGYSIATLDLTTQLTRLRESKVDYIWMLGITGNAVVAVRDATSLGIAGQTPFTFMEYAESDELIRQAGSKVQGFYDYQPHSAYSENAKAAQLYSQIYKWAQNKDVWSDNRLVITLKGLLAALVPPMATEIKAETLTGDTVLNTLNGLSNIDTWGNNKDFGFGPGKRVGLSSIRIKQYTATGTTAVGDWLAMPRIFEGVVK